MIEVIIKDRATGDIHKVETRNSYTFKTLIMLDETMGIDENDLVCKIGDFNMSSDITVKEVIEKRLLD